MELGSGEVGVDTVGLVAQAIQFAGKFLPSIKKSCQQGRPPSRPKVSVASPLRLTEAGTPEIQLN
jgi:hypothetical protein